MIYLTGAKFEFKPNISGKITTFCQIIMVSLALIGTGFHHPEFLKSDTFMYWAYLTALLTVISGFTYIKRGLAWLLEQTTKA